MIQLRLLLDRCKLLAEARDDERLGVQPDSRLHTALAENAASLGVHRMSPSLAVALDGALRGIHWYESANYHLPVRYRWLTWPLVGAAAVGSAVVATRHVGVAGLLLLGILPLALLAAIVAGAVHALTERRLGLGFVGRRGAAIAAGGTTGAIFLGPLVAVVRPDRPFAVVAAAAGFGAAAGLALDTIDWLVSIAVRRRLHR